VYSVRPVMLLPVMLLLLFSSISFAHSIERVVSLAPSSTELVYAAGLGHKLVAVSEYSNYPEQATSIEKVASFESINIERIVALDPDLIVAWRSGGLKKSLNQLKTLGFKIYYSDTTHLAGIADRIEELSQYADDPKIGRQRAFSFRKELRQLKKQYSHNQPITYFYQLSSKPIFTIANGNWPSEVFSLCGGINIFEQSPIPYPQIGLEQVIVRAPEVIFTSPHTIQNTQMWQQWQEQIPAVKHNFIWSLNADWLNRPTPRSLLAIKQVCNYFKLAQKKLM